MDDEQRDGTPGGDAPTTPEGRDASPPPAAAGGAPLPAASSGSEMWGGRFEGRTEKLVEGYTESISFDRRLYREDIAGSIAHARMLAAQGIIDESDADAIVTGLEAIREEIAAGTFSFRADREDIHLNIEGALTERIGEAAGRLHTARSRNDQVATDLRLFARGALDEAAAALRELRRALIGFAGRERETIIPGYTHLQRAQPVLLAHHLLAYEAMFARDSERVSEIRRRTNVLPLGAGALAGVTYPIDRQRVAHELGFEQLSGNSMDAVSDRDFVVELHAAAALAMVHLSRLAEDLVLWASSEFALLRLPDGFATGSSIMPQKRNPDVAELARGKSARVIGNLVQSLTLLKGLPLSYNRDLQEDKEALFDTVETLLASLRVTAAMLPELGIDAERGRAAAVADHALATDLADHLAKQGVPFREAHRIVGGLVAMLDRAGRELASLTPDELRDAHPAFGEGAPALDVDASLAARDVEGGTAPSAVAAALASASARLEAEARAAAGSGSPPGTPV